MENHFGKGLMAGLQASYADTAAIWRLYCALSQLEQAPVAGTIGEGTT